MKIKTALSVCFLSSFALAGVGCNAVECIDSVRVNATIIHSGVSLQADQTFNEKGDFTLKYDRAGWLTSNYDSTSAWDNLFGKGKNVRVSNGQASITYDVPGATAKTESGARKSCTTVDDITLTTLRFESGDTAYLAMPNSLAHVESLSLVGPELVIDATFDLDSPNQPEPPTLKF